MRKTTPMVQRLGMAEARGKLTEFAATLAREPDRIVEVTRRGRPVLQLMAPPRVARQASAARRILQQVASLGRGSTGKRRDVARRYKALLYGDD